MRVIIIIYKYAPTYRLTFPSYATCEIKLVWPYYAYTRGAMLISNNLSSVIDHLDFYVGCRASQQVILPQNYD